MDVFTSTGSHANKHSHLRLSVNSAYYFVCVLREQHRQSLPHFKVGEHEPYSLQSCNGITVIYSLLFIHFSTKSQYLIHTTQCLSPASRSLTDTHTNDVANNELHTHTNGSSTHTSMLCTVYLQRVTSHCVPVGWGHSPSAPAGSVIGCCNPGHLPQQR